MKKILTTFSVVVSSIVICSGIVYAATHDITSQLGGSSGDSFDVQGTMLFDSIKVGRQDEGGVTFFNGTIVNNTTTGGADNPVTFGDNVRIDGRVYRGSSPGTSDTQPFIVNDKMQVTGNLSVASLTVTDNQTISGTLTLGDGDPAAAKKILAGNIQITEDGDAIATYDTTTDCGDCPSCYDYYDYHYAKIAVPEVSYNNLPNIRVFGAIEPSEGYGSTAYLDLDEEQFVPLSFSLTEGYVYVQFKNITYGCDGLPNDPTYYTNGEYKILIFY
ncbi:MAG: hypothetical protein ABIB97_04315 [Patescibacteria group bacterium]